MNFSAKHNSCTSSFVLFPPPLYLSKVHLASAGLFILQPVCSVR